MITEIILAPSPNLQPAPFFTPTLKAAKRVLEFFTGQINNDHTRRAYMNATRRFAAFIKDLQAEVSPPTVKQHLAALRMLLDWLVTGHVIDVNPAHAVRGPKYVVKKGKTPVLAADEQSELIPVGGVAQLKPALRLMMSYRLASRGPRHKTPWPSSLRFKEQGWFQLKQSSRDSNRGLYNSPQFLRLKFSQSHQVSADQQFYRITS